MQNQLVQFASNHPIAVTAAAAATALLFFLQRHYYNQHSEKESIIKLTNQGPEFQIVQAIELMGRYYNLNCTKSLSSSATTTKQVSGLSRFFFRRDEVGQFFNKNEHDLQSFFPIAETLSSIHSILADAANEAQLIEKRRKESFDDKNQEHLEMLKKLWRLGIVDDEDVNNDSSIAFERHSSKWDKLGFQGQDPATDLRGGGVLALEMFVSFVEKNSDLVKMMQRHNAAQHREGGLNWMLIACASIHITVTLFKQIGDGTNNSNGFSVWTRPLLMAIYRGSAIMKFHPKAKIPDSERAGFMPTPRDYQVGLVRVVAVSEAMLKDESTHSLSEDFDISAAVANSPERNRKSDNDDSDNNNQNLLLSSSSSSSSTYPRVRTGRMQKWSLYSSICRVHHFLMRRLFEEWIEKKPSVMEFETFIVKKVYEPFFLSENPVLL